MATRARKRQCAHRQKPLWELEEEDHLLHMDPRLMTERQQLAFLLRTTAHEASEASGESSEDEVVASPRRAKKPRRIQQSLAVTTPRRGPGRPPKHKKRQRAAAPKLHVKTRENKEVELEAKPSPSGSDEVTQLDAARSFAQRTPRCALCCDYDTAQDASFSDALFLCPACDLKYPTQQALGRRACVT
jgi:hypothetical protein